MRLLQHHFDALSLHIFQDHLCLKLYGFHYQFHLVINLVSLSLELIDFDFDLGFDFGFNSDYYMVDNDDLRVMDELALIYWQMELNRDHDHHDCWGFIRCCYFHSSR